MRIGDIHTLSEFQRTTRKFIERLRKTGRPEVLTVNGKPRLVVQDAEAYQRLLQRKEFDRSGTEGVKRKGLFEIAGEARARMRKDAGESFPADASERLDCYLYGTNDEE